MKPRELGIRAWRTLIDVALAAALFIAFPLLWFGLIAVATSVIKPDRFDPQVAGFTWLAIAGVALYASYRICKWALGEFPARRARQRQGQNAASK